MKGKSYSIYKGPLEATITANAQKKTADQSLKDGAEKGTASHITVGMASLSKVQHDLPCMTVAH